MFLRTEAGVVRAPTNTLSSVVGAAAFGLAIGVVVGMTWIHLFGH